MAKLAGYDFVSGQLRAALDTVRARRPPPPSPRRPPRGAAAAAGASAASSAPPPVSRGAVVAAAAHDDGSRDAQLRRDGGGGAPQHSAAERERERERLLLCLASAAIAGVGAAVVSQPADTLLSRMCLLEVVLRSLVRSGGRRCRRRRRRGASHESGGSDARVTTRETDNRSSASQNAEEGRRKGASRVPSSLRVVVWNYPSRAAAARGRCLELPRGAAQHAAQPGEEDKTCVRTLPSHPRARTPSSLLRSRATRRSCWVVGVTVTSTRYVDGCVVLCCFAYGCAVLRCLGGWVVLFARGDGHSCTLALRRARR